jgi:DNA-binding PadR family transcriptional regulator
VQQGSLYPALHRLERRGWVTARWGASENNRRAKYYELTRSGRKQLEAEKDAWRKLAAAVAQVLEHEELETSDLAEREWARVPSDLSKNVDHYLYGSKKSGK